MNHFTRLVDLTSADDAYVSSLAASMAPCILRPRTETSITMEEKHAYRLICDLFAFKDAIFGALKRMSSLTHTGSVGTGNRPRAISSDESNRRAHMEERQRAILEKASGGRSRATSPAPSPRGAGHRHDRSIGGPETRFPIHTSPAAASDRHRPSLGSAIGPKRTSLEVPGGAGEQPAQQSFVEHLNGSPEAKGEDGESDVNKRDSLGRSGARFVGGRRVTALAGSPSTPPSHQSGDETHVQHAVTLVDGPMDN